MYAYGKCLFNINKNIKYEIAKKKKHLEILRPMPAAAGQVS